MSAGSGSGLDQWVERWTVALAAARAKGQDDATAWGPGRVAVGPPATNAELDALEAQIGIPIPTDLRSLFTAARSAEAVWHLDADLQPPAPMHEVFAGRCVWSVDALPGQVEELRRWVSDVFPDASDAYSAVWHDKFPFLDAMNGDVVAIDSDGRVVYLSHDDGEGHGHVLGRDLIEFLNDWTQLGCPGPEDWQWLPFIRDRSSGLDPDGGPGRAWRSWLGIP